MYAPDFDIKNIFIKTFKIFLSIFKRKIRIDSSVNLSSNDLIEEQASTKKPQQSFLFESSKKEIEKPKNNIDYLR